MKIMNGYAKKTYNREKYERSGFMDPRNIFSVKGMELNKRYHQVPAEINKKFFTACRKKDFVNRFFKEEKTVKKFADYVYGSFLYQTLSDNQCKNEELDKDYMNDVFYFMCKEFCSTGVMKPWNFSINAGILNMDLDRLHEVMEKYPDDEIFQEFCCKIVNLSLLTAYNNQKYHKIEDIFRLFPMEMFFDTIKTSGLPFDPFSEIVGSTIAAKIYYKEGNSVECLTHIPMIWQLVLSPCMHGPGQGFGSFLVNFDEVKNELLSKAETRDRKAEIKKYLPDEMKSTILYYTLIFDNKNLDRVKALVDKGYDEVFEEVNGISFLEHVRNDSEKSYEVLLEYMESKNLSMKM